MKTKEREEARRLRQEDGLSMKQIAAALGVSVSSISLWVRDIELDHVQRSSLRSRAAARRGAATAATAKLRRLAYQESGRLVARNAGFLHLAGCMLFWAEGSKSRNAVVFTNSDPEMLRFFLRFLRECYAVPDSRVRVTCNLFADHIGRQRDVEQRWLDALALPRSQLARSTVNVYSKHSRKKRRNKLPYGTCRLAVHDTALVQSIYGAIQEYAGFDRPEWLG